MAKVHHMAMDIRDPAIDFLTDKSFDPDKGEKGGRPVKRAMDVHLRNKLSEVCEVPWTCTYATKAF